MFGGKMKKLKYEKPMSLDAGSVAPIKGANCSNGTGASDLCRSGNNPDIVYLCITTGNTADGNCEANGNTAGSVCMDGGTPRPGRCYAGSSV
jgi:hypothetical protein